MSNVHPSRQAYVEEEVSKNARSTEFDVHHDVPVPLFANRRLRESRMANACDRSHSH